MKQKKDKPIPDATVYLTKSGERVRISKSKQFPSHPNDRDWEKELRKQANERLSVIRITDGHELWGITKEDLTPE